MTSAMLEVDDGVATLTLNRPDRMNAFDLESAARIRSAVESLDHPSIRVVVIAGAGRGFCAGGDVRAMASAADPSEYLRMLTHDVHGAISALRRLEVPIVARVHGPVAGGGIGLLLVSDLVIASRSATFSAAYGELGLSPDCGVAAGLPEVVGTLRARDFLLTGERIDAETARAWGLVARVVADAELDAAVAAAIGRLRAGSRAAHAATKSLLRRDDEQWDARLAREADAIVDLARGEAAAVIAQWAGSSIR